MSKSLNNFCEDLVNGSRPRYAGSQMSLSDQVAWQVKKEEEGLKALQAECLKRTEAQFKRDFTPPPAPTYTAPTPTYTAPTFSLPTYSPPAATVFPTYDFTAYNEWASNLGNRTSSFSLDYTINGVNYTYIM